MRRAERFEESLVVRGRSSDDGEELGEPGYLDDHVHDQYQRIQVNAAI